MKSRVKLDRFGRVVIPKPMREALGLEPGASLLLEEHGDGLHLSPLIEDVPLVEEDGLLVFCGEPAGDLDGAIAAHRADRLEQIP